MSAYIVSDQTIAAIVYAMQRAEFANSLEGISARTRPQKVGQMLLDQNYKSVNWRYGENDAPRQFKYAQSSPILAPAYDFTFGEMYGSICCYMYQACETPDWLQSEIYFTMQSLKDDLTEKMLAELGQEMEWGIE